VVGRFGEGVLLCCWGDGVPRPSGSEGIMVVVTDRTNTARHVEAGSHACPREDGAWRTRRGDGVPLTVEVGATSVGMDDMDVVA